MPFKSVQRLAAATASLKRFGQLLKSAAPRLFPSSQPKAVKELAISTRPRVSQSQSISLAERLFSLQTSSPTGCVQELESYKDRNFLIRGTLSGQRKERSYVLKVLNSKCSRNQNLISTTSELLFFLNSNGICCPLPQTSIFGTHHVPCRLLKKRLDNEEMWNYKFEEHTQRRDICDTFQLVSEVSEGDDMDDVYVVRMYSFVAGEILRDVKWKPELLVSLGAKIAQMHKIFKEFSETKSSLERIRDWFEWDLRNFPDVISLCGLALEDDKQSILHGIATQFQNDVLPKIDKLDTQIIHGDINAHNIIVETKADGDFNIKGFIDFDHSQYSHRVFDVAIVLAYIMLETENQGFDPIEASNHVIAGYQSEFPLSTMELGMLLTSAMARISVSLSIGAYNYMYSKDLDKEYILYSSKRGWKVIDHLLKIDPDDEKVFAFG